MTRSSAKPHIAILGAGPIGLDAALAAAAEDLSFTVYEAGDRVGENIRNWGHVRLFSPWSMNTSCRMRAALNGAAPEGPECPTGDQLVEQVLDPIAALGALVDHIQTGVRVVGVSRDGTLKDDEIGTGRRSERRFRLLLEEKDGSERIDHADVVLDCTGTFGHPNALGDGGIPAPGERAFAHRIVRTIPVPSQMAPWKGMSILVVGAGHSAQTAVRDLVEAHGSDAQVVWAIRDPAPTFDRISNDPLPDRAGLHERAAELARGAAQGVDVHAGYVVQELRQDGDRLRVTLRHVSGQRHEVAVDWIVSLTGAVGDAGLYRQLQVHECYATSGLMNLSAALLGEDSADCLAQTSHGVDALKSPEPGFFVLGAKSYGRNATFLLPVGYDQIGEVFESVVAEWAAVPQAT